LSEQKARISFNDRPGGPYTITPDVKAKIDEILEKYKEKRGSLIPVMQQVQGVTGYLPFEVQTYVAESLNINPSEVYGVATFYAFFSLKPRGRHGIKVCLGTACYVKGGERIFQQLEKDLHVKSGETTDDKRFTLEGVRCVGACGLAPVVVIDDDVHRQVDVMSLKDIVGPYK